MAQQVRVALFGNGFARRVMLPCLAQVDGAEVVGIASPNQERLAETAREFSIPFLAADHREVLDKTRPDLVLVVTPPDRHREQAIDALRAGCHVICEKPTAIDAGQSGEMLEVAAGSERLALLDHELRLDPRRRQVAAWIEQGRLGTIRHATYTICSTGFRSSGRSWSWWNDANRGGGTLGALGSHAVDALRSMLGEIASVRGSLHTFVAERPDPDSGVPRAVTSDDFAAAWLRFASGALATITLSLVEAERVHRMTIAGEDGAIRLDEQQPLLAAFGDGPLQPVEVDEELGSNQALGIPDTDWARNFLRLARAAVTAIKAGKRWVEGAADFDDGHRNQLVLDAIRRSSATGAWEGIGGDNQVPKQSTDPGT